MRLHRLVVTAFGPFAGTAEVDLDELSDAGLFLLSGPTGAGKTSVLDAVCFALYGDVPGDRGTARRLRCDTAPPLAAPRVELEATLGGRRFRFVRQPAWERPKKRGTGTTTEQAKVLVEELDPAGGPPVALTTRADEAGQLVTGLLGMTLTQFCQVALLPQGRFEAFLRARPDDRQRLLQRLFRTERFADVERWLKEHRSDLRRREDEAQQAVRAAVGRLEEAAGADPTEAVDGDPDEAALRAWAEELVAATAEAAAATTAAARDAADEAQRAQERAAEAHRTLEAVTRGRRALEEVHRLDACADDLADAQARLALADRALPVLPLLRVAERSRVEARTARDRAGALGEACWELVGALQPTPEELRAACAQAEEHLAAVRAAAPRARARDAARREEASAAAALERLRGDLERLEAEAAGLPTSRDAAREALAAAERHAARVPALEAEERDLAARLEARTRADELVTRLGPAREAVSAARAEVLLRKERWLALREARLDGMAAELARDLAVGACCPVCGSDAHPHKASPGAGVPGEADERAARAALDDAEMTLLLHTDQVRDLEMAWSAADAAAGEADGPALTARRGEARRALAAARAAAESTAACRRELEALDQRARQLDEERSALDADLARLDAVRAQQGRAAAEAAGEVAAALGTDGDVDPALLLPAAERSVQQLTLAVRAVDDADRATAAAAAAQTDAEQCARDHGFDDAADATAAALDDAERATTEQRVRTAEADRVRAQAVLADPLVAAALAAADEDPRCLDVGACDAEAADAARRARSAAGAAHTARGRAERTAALHAGLLEVLAVWGPVRASYGLAERVASFCEGRSADNRLRTRLSAYVVAWRLGQVVDAANLRLDAMSDGRYALEHTGERGAGETRGGLGLLVRDAWSGAARDPVTLSGGETFVVALALALGLADVVVQEAGGADLGTLFVDEGFGSLDADTLDDVLDHLDALRDGGRVVGVVSHVAEVRDRVPVRLEVRKDRGGSTLRTVRG